MNRKITKQQIALVAVLMVGGIALATDRLTAGGEVHEDAASYAVAPTKAQATAPVVATFAGPALPEHALADRLKKLAGPFPAQVDDVRNLFGVARPPGAGASVRQSNGSYVDPAELLMRHTLNGVMFRADRTGVAIIDGRPIVVGSKLDGFTLVRVTQKEAVFISGPGQVVLKLAEK